MGAFTERPSLVGMKMKCGSLVCTAIGFFLTACRQEAPAPEETAFEASAQQEDAPIPASPDLPLPVLPSTEVTIERVESLMVSRPNEETDVVIILASGLVGSRGWSRPRLVPVNTDETPNTVSFYFIATSPERDTPESEPQPIEAQLEMSEFSPEVEIVRIIGATNELTAIVDN